VVTLPVVAAVFAERLHRFTVDEYLRLVSEGSGGAGPTELVDGGIYDVSPEWPLHTRAVVFVLGALCEARPDREVRAAGSVEIGPHSLWSPDVYMLGPDAPAGERRYPVGAEVELTVEVSAPSHGGDLTAKYRGYAAAGIAEYWMLVPEPAGFLLRHRQPLGEGYELVDRFELPGGYATLDVAALLG
jgi:Uma2 family endonuclease